MQEQLGYLKYTFKDLKYTTNPHSSTLIFSQEMSDKPDSHFP